VHASSAARFDTDIRKLACDAGIPGYDDPKSDAFALVYSWLRDKRNGKWIQRFSKVVSSGLRGTSVVSSPPRFGEGLTASFLYSISKQMKP
jgi:hypothetical protein